MMLDSLGFRLLPLMLGLAACGAETPPSTGDATRTAERTAMPTDEGGPVDLPGPDDFPFEVHRSPPAIAATYTSTRRQALEKVVDNLRGACTKEAWRMAKEFFGRAPEDAAEPLIEALDRGMQSQHSVELVQNVAEALGRMGRYQREDVAEALLRALRHQKVSVQNSAMAGLVQAGTPATIREARKLLDGLEQRARLDWIRAVARRMPANEADDILREFIHSDDHAQLFGTIMEEVVALPPERAANLLRPIWRDAGGSLRLTIASVLHLVGDRVGTQFLTERLADDNPEMRAGAVRALSADLEYVRDDVLRLSLDPEAKVREAVILAIAATPGENVDNILTSMALDRVTNVRQAALAALRARGVRGHLDRLIEQIKTESGSMVTQVLLDLAAAGDGQSVSAIRERMLAAPQTEHRMYIQALGRMGATEGFAVLRDVFLEPEHPIDDGGVQTSVSYVATVLANFPSQRDELLELYERQPKADYRRRAYLMHTLGNVASLATAGFPTQVYDMYRKVLSDPSELPEMRLLALEYLRRDLSVDDAMRIKRQLMDEEPAMRSELVSFLYEFF